ncbi:multisubunit Na+/H+ antiporter MnhB subunit [Cryobacterium sp. CAN_C3]|nr:multisubunit Na+/H+ antiporter MnhB subunit [Cryobacterium sp. CAN_C3]
MLEALLVGITVFVIIMIVGPMIRRRKLRDGGRTPTAVWVVVALLLVGAIALSIYGYFQPR